MNDDLDEVQRNLDNEEEEEAVETLSTSQTLYLQTGRSKKTLVLLATGLNNEDGSPLIDLKKAPWNKRGTRSVVKPSREQYQGEVERRATLFSKHPMPRPGGWMVSKCIAWLEANPINATADVSFIRAKVQRFVDIAQAAAIEENARRAGRRNIRAAQRINQDAAPSDASSASSAPPSDPRGNRRDREIDNINLNSALSALAASICTFSQAQLDAATHQALLSQQQFMWNRIGQLEDQATEMETKYAECDDVDSRRAQFYKRKARELSGQALEVTAQLRDLADTPERICNRTPESYDRETRRRTQA